MRKEIQWLIAFGMLFANPAVAQEKAELTFSTDIVSGYVWRGKEQGSASIQPLFGVSWKGFSLMANGNVGFVKASDPRELDLIGTYTNGGFSVGLVDYWTDDPVKQYFRYKAHHTSHVFEAFVGYDFGVVSLSWQTNFAGNDGVNRSGSRAYSSYFEAIAPFRLLTCNWEATVGICPYSTDYYQADQFSVINLSLRATKELRLTDRFTLPLWAQLTANPESGHAYFVFGITLNAIQ